LKYKKLYAQELIRKFECDEEDKKLNVLEAINFIGDAWKSVTQQTIRNCWEKTGILPNSEPETAIEEQRNLEKNDIENLQQVLSSETAKNIGGLTTYINDNEIVPTEEFLDDEQIIELATQSAEFDSSSSDKELVLVSHKEGLNALTTFIEYFEQQADAEFKAEDLHTLKKYN
ncbi:2540_t:CDS:2, partial [Gigaspora margarita]